MAIPTTSLLSLAEAAANAEGVPPPLLKGLVEVESAWNPKAFRAEPHINDASYGLTQTLYGTARDMGYQGPPEGLYNPAESLKWGAKYLRRMLAAFDGNWALALAAYNAGPGNARKAIRATGSMDPATIDPHLPAITRAYWRKVLTWARHYAGQISRADAIIQAKTGEITAELLAFANSSTGRYTGFFVLMLALAGALILGGNRAS